MAAFAVHSKSYYAFTAFHFVLLVLAVVVAGLYGFDLQRAAEADKHGDARWIYAEVVAGLSALTAVVLMVPSVLRFAAVWVWDLVLLVLWIALFGLFGKVSAGTCLLKPQAEETRHANQRRCVPDVHPRKPRGR
jgi:hypothetical protein